MSPLTDFRDLEVWQSAMDLAVLILRAAPSLPADERFGLASQLRKAAVSIRCNVAEGYGRGSRPDYLRFLHIARGSTNEVLTLLLLCKRMDYLTDGVLEPMLTGNNRVQAMLHRLISSLRQ